MTAKRLYFRAPDNVLRNEASRLSDLCHAPPVPQYRPPRTRIAGILPVIPSASERLSQDRPFKGRFDLTL